MTLAGPTSFIIPFTAVEISYYRLFLVIALSVTLVATLWLIKKSELNFKSSFWTLVAAATAFLIGARLFNVLVRPELYRAEPWRLYSLDATGFSLYGG